MARMLLVTLIIFSPLFAMEKDPGHEFFRSLKDNPSLFARRKVTDAAIAVLNKVQTKRIVELIRAGKRGDLEAIGMFQKELSDIRSDIEALENLKTWIKHEEDMKKVMGRNYKSTLVEYLKSCDSQVDATSQEKERAFREEENRQDRASVQQPGRPAIVGAFERAQTAILEQNYERLLEVILNNKFDEHEIQTLLGIACQKENAQIIQCLFNKQEEMQGSSRMGGFGKTNNNNNNNID